MDRLLALDCQIDILRVKGEVLLGDRIVRANLKVGDHILIAETPKSETLIAIIKTLRRYNNSVMAVVAVCLPKDDQVTA